MTELTRRAAARQKLIEGTLDVLVVGGGIVGAGIARDAAMRGYATALVEQHDMAYGTSSRSSRLLHGGIRYLAQGRLGLVYEASREKMILHRIAPHLAVPLEFVFPSYRNTGWPLWQLRVGVKLYDFLCGRNLGRSRSLSAEATTRLLPGLNAEGLAGAVSYFDGFTNDARLVIDTLRSAERHGATLLNYARLESAELIGEKPSRWRCRIHDVCANEDFEVEAGYVINATGPWAQSLPQSSVKLRLTKGVHLVIDRARLPVPCAVVVTEGTRILFVIPWGERLILGTTDTDYSGPPEAVKADAADIDYILSTIGRRFPAAKLTPDDVIRTWAGLRPLIDTGHERAGPGRPSDISRAHQILTPKPGWIDVAGGKLTSYRLIAEQAFRRVPQHKPFGSRTVNEPLLPPDAVQYSGILPPPISREVVTHCCRHEWAEHLDDVMLRRTGWHYYYRDAAQIAVDVAGWMADEIGWDAMRGFDEVERYEREL